MPDFINAAAGTTRRMQEMDAMTGVPPPAVPIVPPAPIGAVPRKVDPLTGLLSPAPTAAIGAVPSTPVAPMASPPAMGLSSAIKRMFGFGAVR